MRKSACFSRSSDVKCFLVAVRSAMRVPAMPIATNAGRAMRTTKFRSLETPFAKHMLCWVLSPGVQRVCWALCAQLTQGKSFGNDSCQPLALPLTTSLSIFHVRSSEALIYGAPNQHAFSKCNYSKTIARKGSALRAGVDRRRAEYGFREHGFKHPSSVP